jgi:hypothetical protein
MTSLYLALDLSHLLGDPADLSEVECPACHDSMEIHQPDAGRARRLLGVCPSCGAWYLIDPDRRVMCRLPDEDAMSDA